MTELSIIVPVFNSEKYLDKCIKSILAQTFSSFELILVDDASTDSSGIICDSYALVDKRIKVIHHIVNKGLSISREDGFLQSHGKWISFIDNDDFIAPTMYEYLMNSNDMGELICVRGEDKTSQEIDEAVWNTNNIKSQVIPGKEFCTQVYAKQKNYGCVGPIWAKIIRRDLIEQTLDKVSVYKKKLYWVYFEDVLFVPILFYYTERIVFIDKLLYMHRHIKSNLSSTLVPSEYHYETIHAKKIVLEFFLRQGLLQAYNEFLLDCLLEVQSIWYKVWKNEKDVKKKMEFNEFVEQYYQEYYKDINYKHIENMGKYIKKISIFFFKENRVLWGKTIGNFYFCVIRKFLY